MIHNILLSMELEKPFHLEVQEVKFFFSYCRKKIEKGQKQASTG